MATSISSAINKLRLLLTKQEKIKWCGIIFFALGTSLLEVITASVIIVFAQTLNQPTAAYKYINLIGLSDNLSYARIVCYMAILCGATYLIKNSLAAIEVFYQNFTIQKMNYQFKNKLLQQYAAAEYSFYLTRNSALSIAVVSEDTEAIFSTGMISLAIIISESLVFLCLLSMIIAINPSLAVIIFGFIGVASIIVAKGLFPLFYRWGQKLQEASLLSNKNLLQFFHAFKEIVLLGKKEIFIDTYKMYSSKKSRIQATQTATNNLPRIIIEMLFVGLFMITISYLCFKHDTPQNIMGILGGYLYVGFRLMPGLNRIINQLNSFKHITPAIERAYIEYTTITNKENYLDCPNFTFNQNIIFKDLYFRYPNTDQYVLNNINLEINKGEVIGIVGETGSGKSTLIDLLLGLLKPAKGSVLIDHSYQANCYDWHKKIGYVPQSIYLVDDTIEANIAFGEELAAINHVRLNKAIDGAQLRKFVAQLPLGVKTIVGERGIRLSGGERQRIAIARALYIEPEVLVFDEATSALDNDTEARLMETINAVSKTRTVIMVAHRLTTLKNCDRIIIMSAGEITDSYANYQQIVSEVKPV